MVEDDIKALEKRIKALEAKIDKQGTALLQGQIDSLKAELALRLESTEKVINTKIDSTEKICNEKNKSTNVRITSNVKYFGITFGIVAFLITIAIPGITYWVSSTKITDWAKNNLREIAKEEVQRSISGINFNDMAKEMLGMAIESERHGDSKSSTDIPSKYDEWYQKGESALKNGNYSNAITFFTNTLKMTSDSTITAYSHQGIGIASSVLGRYAEALNSFSKAIDYKPDYGLAYNNRGYIYTRLGQNDEAFEDYNFAIKLFINERDYKNAEMVIRNMKNRLAALEQAIIADNMTIPIKDKARRFISERGKELEKAKKETTE